MYNMEFSFGALQIISGSFKYEFKSSPVSLYLMLFHETVSTRKYLGSQTVGTEKRTKGQTLGTFDELLPRDSHLLTWLSLNVTVQLAR